MKSDVMTNAWSFGPIALVCLLSIAAFLLGSLISRNSANSASIASPVLFSAALNIAILVYRVVVDKELLGDEVSWHQDGMLVSQFLRGESQSIQGELGLGKEGYAWLLGSLYALVGPVPFVAIWLNILLLTLLVPVWVQITLISGRQLGMSKKQLSRSITLASYAVGTMPIIVFWAPRLLREIPSMFLIGVAVLCFLRFINRKSPLMLTLMFAAVLALTSIRMQIGIGLFASLGLSAIVVWSIRFRSNLTRAIFVLPAFAAFFTATWVSVNETADLSVDNATYRNQALTDASSAFSGAEQLQYADSVLDIVLFNLPRTLLGPFPSEMSLSSVMLLAAVSNMFWITSLLLSCGLFLRRKTLAGHKLAWGPVLVLLTVTAMLIVALSITAGNYGLVTRMRLMPFATLIPLAALGSTLLFPPRARSKTAKTRNPERGVIAPKN